MNKLASIVIALLTVLVSAFLVGGIMGVAKPPGYGYTIPYWYDYLAYYGGRGAAFVTITVLLVTGLAVAYEAWKDQ